jgi:hypothetical protein
MKTGANLKKSRERKINLYENSTVLACLSAIFLNVSFLLEEILSTQTEKSKNQTESVAAQ